jgi:diguanylate cyclase (GGDEF)-like protein
MNDAALSDEVGRLTALAQYDILDTAPEQPLERLVSLVQGVLGVPMAAITFIDENRQWFKAKRGLGGCETSREDAFCTHTIRSRDPMIVGDASQDLRFCNNPFVIGEPHVASYLGIPLITRDGFALGALCAMDTVPRLFSQTQVRVMTDLAGLVCDWLEMRHIAECDFLTGALTRRAMLAEMERELSRARRYARPSALALCDIDRFKSVNDNYGHAFGDEVLKTIGRVCLDTLRAEDRFGRIGGEEFVLLLPETGPAEAVTIVERLRREIAALRFDAQPHVQITASFGIAALADACAEPSHWLALADIELYRAKQAGRNRSFLSEAA